MKILIIAGHGGADPGAIGCGFKEAALTREVADRVYDTLYDYCDVALYNTTKDCYSQVKQGKAPEWSYFDYVIEIHFNAFSDTTVNGTEILIDKSEKYHTVEDCILNNLVSLGFKNRGIKRRNDLLNMNQCTNAGTSYSLVETCFITNQRDVTRYQSNKDAVANAIANGIIEGFGLSKSSTNVSRETFYCVQVGAFNKKENAELLAKELTEKGYEAWIINKEVKK